MTLVLPMILYVTVPPARALPPDRPALCHCGALLMPRAEGRAVNQAEVTRWLDAFRRRAGFSHAGIPGAGYAPVRLGVDGESLVNPTDQTSLMLARSESRLSQLERDLTRPLDVKVVLSTARGDKAIGASLHRHRRVMRSLDAAVYDARRERLDLIEIKKLRGTMGLGFFAGGVLNQAAGLITPVPAATGVLGLIGIGYLMGPTEELLTWYDLRRPRISPLRDAVDRFLVALRQVLDAGGAATHVAHVGFSVRASESLEMNLRQAASADDLKAEVLFDAEGQTRTRKLWPDRRALLSVDQLFFYDERAKSEVLLNVARLRPSVPRGKPARTSPVSALPFAAP